MHFEWYLFESAGPSPANYGLKIIDRLLSTEANSHVTLDRPGNYVVHLTVSNSKGLTSKTSLPLAVGNTPPQVRFERPAESAFFTPGQPIAYKVRVVDAEDGDSAKDEELMDSHVFVTAHWNRDDGKEEAGQPNLAVMRQ